MYLCLSDGIFLLSSVTSWKEGGEKRERRNSKEREEWEGHRWQGKIITTLKMGYRHRKENGRGKAQGEMPNSQGIKRKGKKWRWQGGVPRSCDHSLISLGKDHRARPTHIGQFRELRPRWGPISHLSAHWLLLPLTLLHPFPPHLLSHRTMVLSVTHAVLLH